MNWYDELYHHGIKGQKKGVRRFQNEDGTLTPEGRSRYGGYKTSTYNAVPPKKNSNTTNFTNSDGTLTTQGRSKYGGYQYTESMGQDRQYDGETGLANAINKNIQDDYQLAERYYNALAKEKRDKDINTRVHVEENRRKWRAMKNWGAQLARRDAAAAEVKELQSLSSKNKRWRKSVGNTIDSYRNSWRSGARTLSGVVNKYHNSWRSGAREIGNAASLFGKKWTKGAEDFKKNWKRGAESIGNTVGSLLKRR